MYLSRKDADPALIPAPYSKDRQSADELSAGALPEPLPFGDRRYFRLRNPLGHHCLLPDIPA